MKKVITMGEIMLRLSTPDYLRIVQTNSFSAIYGGGESNVAVSLANYGLETYFVSKVPKHDIGQSAINYLQKYGVQTEYITRGGERLGIYFLETGASMRASNVLYDRTESSIAQAEISDFNFDDIFKDADWFHFSGITPAISKSAAKLTEAALIAAKKYGVMVSVDLNYRKKLWTPEDAKETMSKLMQYVDICIGIGSEADAEIVLGFKPTADTVLIDNLNLDENKNILKRVQSHYNIKYVVTSLRECHSASDNSLSALIYDGNEFYQSPKYPIRIVDRVGGGDSFAAALIYALITNKSCKDSLDFAVAASALKHTIFGDLNHINISEVETLLDCDQSGRINQ